MIKAINSLHVNLFPCLSMTACARQHSEADNSNGASEENTKIRANAGTNNFHGKRTHVDRVIAAAHQCVRVELNGAADGWLAGL